MFNRHSHILKQITAQILLIAGSLFIALDTVHAQLNIPNPKQIIKDTTNIAAKDTIKRYPLKIHGTLIQSKTANSISKYDIQFTNYLTINDILCDHLDILPIDLGSFGQYNSFMINGSNPSSIAYSFNSRPLMDPVFGLYSSELFPAEFLEKIEIVTGSDAVLMSDNAEGALINFQEIVYNSKKPFTRMYFAQGPYEYLQADGVYSKNLTSEMNFTFGFRSQSSSGRYDNSEMQSWNLRTLLRWNPNDNTSISLSDIFANHKSGMFGGIDPYYDNDLDGDGVTNIYDEIEAGVRLPNFRERNYRHDITLKYTTIDTDSNHVLSSSLFLTNSEFIWGNYPTVYQDTTLFNDLNNISNYYGINGQYEFHNIIDWVIGGKYYYLNIDPTRFSYGFKNTAYSVFTRVSGEISNLLRVTGGIKYGNKFDKDLFAIGGSITAILTDSTSWKFDISQSNRPPNPTENLTLDSEIHRLILSEFEYRRGSTKLRLGAYYRNIDKPIVPESDENLSNSFTFVNGSTRNLSGLSLRYSDRITGDIFKPEDFLEFNLMLQGNYNIDNPEELLYPMIYADITLLYQLNVNRSILRFGIRAKGSSDYSGFNFTPLSRTYFYDGSNSSNIFNGINAFVQTRLGSAHIRAEIENILSYQYYYIPYYPMNEMNFKLIISWTFLE